MSFDLPDQLTNQATPKDTDGNPIEDGRWYLVGKPRQRKPNRVLVRYDVDSDLMLCQPKGGGLWQRIDEMDPDIYWEPVDED